MPARPSPKIAEDVNSITVLIVDDEPLVRKFLAEIVDGHSLFEVVGVAADASEAISLAEVSLPDLALVDVKMPGGGPQATRGILECSPQTRVVALSAHEERAVVLEMVRAGAVSYVVKGGEPEEIIETLLRSAHGESILSAEVSSGVIEELASQLERRHLEEHEELELRARVRRVIDEALFDPVFQPIVDLGEGRAVGVEALCRFSAEPLQGPARWFADAERVGLRSELELAAARAAVERLGDIPDELYLSLNASPETLPLCGELVEARGDRVVIEITEHAAIEDYSALRLVLGSLRASGVRFAVDDAGAGFASLHHALQLSPDFVKLDVSLTRGIDSDRRRHALASGLIGFAEELGAAIIAEGVETRPELDALRALGVPYGQGYFLSPPGPLPLDDRQLSHLRGLRRRSRWAPPAA